MKRIIEENYKSIIRRGLINSKTTEQHFLEKLNEEVSELWLGWETNDDENIREEIADVIMVCLNFARHFNIDIEKEIKNKIEVNKFRALNG